jgi:hypothetical protein
MKMENELLKVSQELGERIKENYGGDEFNYDML